MKLTKVLLAFLAFSTLNANSAPMDHKKDAFSGNKVFIERMTPGRDDAAEDSVVFEYGFENDWNGWTTDDLTDPGNKWHATEYLAYEGESWWAGDPVLRGYDNHWLQYLVSPRLDLSGRDNVTLEFMIQWSVEQPGGEPEGYNGWDGCNLWVSTNDGQDWQVLQPVTPAYMKSSLYSFGVEWNMGPNIPGWVGNSGNQQWPTAEWVNAEFDLSQFAGNENVRVRWAFCSDPGWATGGENDAGRNAFGMMVDNIRVREGDDIFWANDGEDNGDLTFDRPEGTGDFWTISDRDRNSGQFSAHCPVRLNLNNALVTPEIEVPAAGWYTWLEFYVRCDMLESDPDDDGILDELFSLDVWDDETLSWQRVIYDYARENFPNQFIHYVPGTFFNQNYLDWQIQLNFTQFAGKTIKLRWVAITDDQIGNQPGTGLYIDDVALYSTSRWSRDVGIDWVHIPFPTSIGFPLTGTMNVTNFGMEPMNNIQKFFDIDGGRAYPILPWPREILTDSSSQFPIDFTDRLLYSDSVTVNTRITPPGDENIPNNFLSIPNVVVHPANIWKLGYDSRAYQYRFNFDQGTGPAVRFTPRTDGVGNNEFNINAIHVRWDGNQEIDAEVQMHIFADNDGEIGQSLYSEMVTVQRNHLLPLIHTINLVDVNELKNLRTNFWVWFELTRQDNFPAIIGDNARGYAQDVRHYFSYNGESKTQMNFEYQIHAVVSPSNHNISALVAGRDSIVVRSNPNSMGTGSVMLFNGGVENITVSAIDIESDIFTARLGQNVNLPYVVEVGQALKIFVDFEAGDEGIYEAVLNVNSDAPEQPSVRIIGSSEELSVENAELQIPSSFKLGEAYPNPFNNQTIIPFALNTSGKVKLNVYDLNGRLMMNLVNAHYEAGQHTFALSAKNLAAGVYFVKLEQNNNSEVQKIFLVK